MLNWPVDGGYLPVELAGEPAPAGDRFAGYRGSGICRDVAALDRLELLRRHKFSVSPHRCRSRFPPIASLPVRQIISGGASSALFSPLRPKLHHQPIRIRPWNRPRIIPGTRSRIIAGTPPGIAAAGARRGACGSAGKRPAVPPARRYAAAGADAGGKQRLQRARPAIVGAPRQRQRRARSAARDRRARSDHHHRARGSSAPQPTAPDWLAPPEPPARGQARRDKALLDLLPAGVLIYRLDRLLYANPAFLRRIGYDSLHALEEAGGLDALYVEPGVSTASSTSKPARR